MRYLMVTTHPPTHCGIGAYGEQSIAQLRSQGHVVDVVSPDGMGNVDFAWDLRGGSKILRLVRLLRYYDRIVIQYHSAFFYRDLSSRDALTTTLSFLALFLRSRKIEVVIHEIPYVSGRAKSLYALQWKLAPRVVMHTAAELQRLEQHYGIRLSRSRVKIRRQEEVYTPYASHTQSAAREQLGLPRDKQIFLCIGFLQRHKGFHRAVRSFVEADLPHAELFVVGSLRIDDSENREYLEELRCLAQTAPTVRLVESFVSNEDFDTWIEACDWVVLPYSEIWSSAVMGRAKLLDRPSIVSQVGGLPDQADDGDLIFKSDSDLVASFRQAAARKQNRRET